MKMLVALITLAIAAPAVAQTHLQMNQSAASTFARADAAMTRQWKATYAAMKARDRGDRSRGGGFGHAAALLESQRAWLRYRDTQCVIEAGRYAGGSMQPMVASGCRARLTDARRAQLRELMWDDM